MVVVVVKMAAGAAERVGGGPWDGLNKVRQRQGTQQVRRTLCMTVLACHNPCSSDIDIQISKAALSSRCHLTSSVDIKTGRVGYIRYRQVTYAHPPLAGD